MVRKRYIEIFIIEILLISALLFNSFVFKIADYFEITGIIAVGLVLSVLLLGYQRDNFRYKTDVFLNITIMLLIYYFVTYFLGFFVGFYRSPYGHSIINVFKNIFPILLIIGATELLRYVLYIKMNSKKIIMFIGLIIFVLIDINMMINTYNVSTNEGLLKMICLVLFPSLTKNIFLCYITQKVGFKNTIYYRAVTELTTFLLPIFPDFGEYLNVVIKTIFPILILVKINNLFTAASERKIKSSRYKQRKLTSYSVITFALLIVVMLTSGYFTYYAVTIGSGSMAPTIDKGDVIVVKKIPAKVVKKKDVLVYNHGNRIIVHRVLEIINDGELGFVTKGDANNAKDSYLVKDTEVIGIVLFRIRFIGMPTVALNELLNG